MTLMYRKGRKKPVSLQPNDIVTFPGRSSLTVERSGERYFFDSKCTQDSIKTRLLAPGLNPQWMIELMCLGAGLNYIEVDTSESTTPKYQITQG